MWIKISDDVWREGKAEGLPPEGIDVITTDGVSEHVMWYLMSSEYRWMNMVKDKFGDPEEAPLPFTPTHWKFLNN